MVEWHYMQNNQQFGPISGQKLKLLAQSGELQPNDLVWKEGMEQWAPAGNIQGLFGDAQVGAAPAPPAAVPARQAAPMQRGAPRLRTIR